MALLCSYRTRNLSIALFFMLAIFLLASCGSVAKKPVSSSIFGEQVSTTVDSEIARYYLSSYLQGRPDNRVLDKRISNLYIGYRGILPSREELKQISRDYSVDFAALFLADLLLKNDCNRMLNRSFRAHLESPTTADLNLSSYQILFVPGWDYVDNGYVTGSDFRKPRKLATTLGIENYLVEIPPTGAVEQNAAFLAREIRDRSRTGSSGAGKGIILAGASSAGPTIHLALGELLGQRERASVKAWINIGGLLQGSPLIDGLRGGPGGWLFNIFAWVQGWDRQGVLSMGTEVSRKRFSRLKTASDLLIINYLGVPLSGQLSRHSRDKYPTLKPQGPNDGLTLLTDAIAPDSLTIVALGSDHYFAEDPEIDRKTVAMMVLVISYLEKGLAGDCQRAGDGWPDRQTAGME